MGIKNISKSFPIVCIGASAGGLEAVTALFNSLPNRINMAFVVVQHLEPHHKSILVEILSRTTSLKIYQAKNNTRVKPGNIYVIPPNSYLSISHRTLKITPRLRHSDGKYLPIDYFMTSLAADQGNKAIGVVLSGTGSDGTLGVEAIKAKGGVTFAQNQKTAKYYSMPAAAIASGYVDFILEPAAISARLTYMAEHKQTVVATKVRQHVNEAGALDKIILLLRDLSGVDFVHYKRTTVERRIIRRMGFRRIKSYRDYYKYLCGDSSEAQILFKDILIPVTMFFRDPGIFSQIRKKVLLRVMKNRPRNDPVRVWVPACSTGEEVYSLAIAIYEFLEENNIKPRLQIFGTDLSDTVIERARAALYKEDILTHVSAVRMRRFFIKTEEGYKIAKHIRDMCIFAKQDITNDPPLSNMDIISCRNLLIYLDSFLQNKVLSVLHYALKPNGFLILGTAESITFSSDLFIAVNKKYKIYSKNVAPRRPAFGRDINVVKPKHFNGIGEGTIRKALAASKTRKAIFSRHKLKTGEMKYHMPAAVKSKKKLSGYRARDLAELEKDLVNTKNHLQAIIEEKDTFNEELKAANEEIQSSNEELQSTNEELETSKEELQSTNEELLTVNDELQNKNVQLTQLNSDLDNVLTSVSIPLIIVKNDLRIMRFTPMARKVMNLIITDIGRPISDIKLNVDIPNLENTILDVIENVTPAESDVKDKAGRWYSVRIRPYKTLDNKIEGAVISMIDIDAERRAQDDIKDALGYADSIIETMREPFLVLNDNLFIMSANRSFYRLFMLSSKDVEKKSIYDICGNVLDVPRLRRALKNVVPKKTHIENLEISINYGKFEERVFSVNARQIYQHGRGQQMILLALEDITKRKRYEDVLRRDEKILQKMVKKQARSLMKAHTKLGSAKRLADVGVLAATVAHELRNPLAAINIAAYNIKAKIKGNSIDKQLATIKGKILESDRIINNLLFYSRLGTPIFESTDIFGLIRECVRMCAHSCKKRKMLINNSGVLKDVFIEADPVQIKEVINNVLNNACDAISVSGGKIQVTGILKDKYVNIVVNDNGSGIDKTLSNKIFDPFFSTKAKGTGLGLSVCKQIVNMHGGEITLQSKSGEGTSVSILLPRKRT